jgi:hypothetical protein
VAPGTCKEMEGWEVAQPKDDLIRGACRKIFNNPQLNAPEERVSRLNNQHGSASAWTQYQDIVGTIPARDRL